MTLRVLALNPFHTGSHEAFLEGWIRHSRHRFTLMTLPGRHWKWRMRHAAVTFARRLHEQPGEWDAVFATDMLNLAEFRGLAPAAVARRPTALYLHENQFTYPVRRNEERDLHFGVTNVVSAVAADAVWFNSGFHRDEFLAAAAETLARLPDESFGEELATLPARSDVLSPGVELDGLPPRAVERSPGPLRVLWVSRWEHDKDPETFFAALRVLVREGVPFELRVLGESYSEQPECFAAARGEFAGAVREWGFLPSRADYRRCLNASDVVVSTARHEFFGIGVVEAVAAGCRPLVPRSLAYPEVLGDADDWFHDDTPAGLAERLKVLASEPAHCAAGVEKLSTKLRGEHGWPSAAARLDDAIAEMVESCGESA